MKNLTNQCNENNLENSSYIQGKPWEPIAEAAELNFEIFNFFLHLEA